MLRILVVEDEPPIMRALVNTIKSFGEEYSVSGTAFNGKKALELVEEKELSSEPFDLVFTDIRMPVMDGLELAEKLYTCHPEISVVVVSGYHEFTYVQSALRSHVYDYITKPVSKDVILPILQKIDALTTERKKSVREKLFTSAVSNNAEAISKSEARYAPFLLCAGAFPTVSDTSMMPGRKFWNTHDTDDIFSHIADKSEDVTCFDGKSECERIAIVGLDSVRRAKEIASSLFAFFENAGLFVTVIYPEKLYSLNDIGECLNRMRIKLQNSIKYLHLSTISEFDDVKVPAISDVGSENIISALLFGKKNTLEAEVRNEVKKLVSVEATQNQISHYFKQIITINAERLSLSADSVNSFFYEVDYSLTNSDSQESFCESLTFLLSNLVENKTQNTSIKSEPPLICEIEQYIKEHFTEDLTNSQLSQVFNFVPSYISKLFRTYRGLSPSEYLMKYRIRTAIKLMEQNPGMLIKDAAANVGLRDQYYFSKLFKKETGKCPSEYFGIKQSK